MVVKCARYGNNKEDGDSYIAVGHRCFLERIRLEASQAANKTDIPETPGVPGTVACPICLVEKQTVRLIRNSKRHQYVHVRYTVRGYCSAVQLTAVRGRVKGQL